MTELCPAELAAPWLHSLIDSYVNYQTGDLQELAVHWGSLESSGTSRPQQGQPLVKPRI